MKRKKSNPWLWPCALSIPLIIVIDLYVVSLVTGLLSAQSDMAVLVGVLSISVSIYLNYSIFKFITKKTGLMKSLKNLFLVGVLAMALVSCHTRIPAGYEGILIEQYGSSKGVQDVNLVTGGVWYNPWTQDVDKVPTSVQTVDYPAFSVNAKDGSVFNVDPTISIRVIAGSSPKIYTKYRKDMDVIINTTVYNYVKDAFRIQFNSYTTDDIISKRAEFENKVQTYLADQLEAEGFHTEQLTSGLQYPSTIVDAINAKNKAVQSAMQAENQLRVAEANARIKIVEAEADAKANELKQRTLTPLLVQKEFIDKWDGHAPLYGGAPTLFKNVQ